jgi:hypothetical protein
MYHTELAKKFKLGGVRLNQIMCGRLVKRKSYEIKAGEWFINSEGNKDRLYSLIRHEPSKAKVKTTCRQACNINPYPSMSKREQQKIARTRAAKKRARLIAMGKYSQEEESKL